MTSTQTEPLQDNTSTPEAVVQRQLDAYNARDINALLATYADDIELYEHPSKLLARGASAARERQSARFAEPNLHATLLRRIVMGNVVVDHEVVTRTFPEGPGTIELMATYEVIDGKIKRAWFLPGPKALAKSPPTKAPPNRALPEFSFREIRAEALDDLRELWEDLRDHHRKLPWAFSHEMSEVTFDARKRELLSKALTGEIRIEVVKTADERSPVAYCISSISADLVAEIDSMFVRETWRRRGLGAELVRRAMSWMEQRGAKRRIVVVADSNDDALALYTRLGFSPRTLTLQHAGGAR